MNLQNRFTATIVDEQTGAPLAARVADGPDERRRILPRELTVFAHTNPVYFHWRGSPTLVPPRTPICKNTCAARFTGSRANPGSPMPPTASKR